MTSLIRYQLYIDGAWCDASDAATFESINPATWRPSTAASRHGKSRYVADYYWYYAGLANKIEGATLPIDKPDLHVFTTREPIGVVAAIVPWNAQMFLSATKLGPALAAGNTVVLKASEDAPAIR